MKYTWVLCIFCALLGLYVGQGKSNIVNVDHSTDTRVEVLKDSETVYVEVSHDGTELVSRQDVTTDFPFDAPPLVGCSPTPQLKSVPEQGYAAAEIFGGLLFDPKEDLLRLATTNPFRELVFREGYLRRGDGFFYPFFLEVGSDSTSLQVCLVNTYEHPEASNGFNFYRYDTRVVLQAASVVSTNWPTFVDITYNFSLQNGSTFFDLGTLSGLNLEPGLQLTFTLKYSFNFVPADDVLRFWHCFNIANATEGHFMLGTESERLHGCGWGGCCTTATPPEVKPPRRECSAKLGFECPTHFTHGVHWRRHAVELFNDTLECSQEFDDICTRRLPIEGENLEHHDYKH